MSILLLINCFHKYIFIIFVQNLILSIMYFQNKSNGTNYSRFLICCLTLLLITCQKDMSLGDENELNANPNTIASSESVALEGDPIILGEKIKSPYSLDTMEKSLNNLRKSNEYGHLAREYNITTTHHYVKFYPESENI